MRAQAGQYSIDHWAPLGIVFLQKQPYNACHCEPVTDVTGVAIRFPFSSLTKKAPFLLTKGAFLRFSELPGDCDRGNPWKEPRQSAIHCGMIATGNHCYFDSLCEAPLARNGILFYSSAQPDLIFVEYII